MRWLAAPARLDGVPFRPKLVLSGGFAGATSEDLRVGDIILASEVVTEAGEAWVTTWPGELPPGPWQPPLIAGRILTVDRVIGTAQEKRRLGLAHGVCAVDMETAMIARWCSRHEIPFGAVRAISDDAATELPPRLLALLGAARLSPMRFVASCCTSPSLIPSLLQLARDTRLAAKNLGRALGELLTLTTPWGEER